MEKIIVAFGAAVVKLLRKLRSEEYADSRNAFKGCWRAKFDATVRVGNKVVEIYRVKKRRKMVSLRLFSTTVAVVSWLCI